MAYARELRSRSRAAEEGDHAEGEKLLRLFAELAENPDGAHPELVRHVARCVGRFLDSENRVKGALKAFCVARPANRPPNMSVRDRHITALREYFRQRALASGVEKAIRCGAKAGSISESAMKRILAQKSPENKVAAMMGLSAEEREKNRALSRKRYVTRK